MVLLLLCILALAEGAMVTISNIIPRRDTNNAILDAHDSKLNYDKTTGLYYWHAASYGNCTEPKGPSGCSPASVGACGFQVDHNVSYYFSPDLVTWTNAGIAFTATNNLPPKSVLFAPKTVYNPNTKLWVMWFNYITESFSNSFYGVATSSNPAGPFTVVNHDVALQFQDNGDEGIFVDDDGQAYVIYTTLSKGHSISIERLTLDYTNSTLQSSGIFGDSFVEAPALFKRGDIYYATFGSCCCYCQSGSPVHVYTATSVLGPYTKRNLLGGSLGSGSTSTNSRVGSLAQLSAPPTANGTITVLGADFGGSCGVHVNLTEAAGGVCNGSANCTWEVCLCGTATCPTGTPGCIADPSYGCAKDLKVSWSCSGDENGAPPRSSYIPPEANGVWARVSCFPPTPGPTIPFGSQQTDVFWYLDSAGVKQYAYVG